MGAFTEFFRHRPGVWRSVDPMFSVAVLGSLGAEWDQQLRTPGDSDCFGPTSIFARLAELDAKLLCWGTDIQALTFVHHAEQVIGVPYRYKKEFPGVVRAPEPLDVVASYNVRRLERGTEVWLHPLASELLRGGDARAHTLPDGPALLLTSAAAVLDTVERRLAANPLYLVRAGHDA